MRIPRPVVVLPALALLTGCATATTSTGSDDPAATASPDPQVRVLASFYPLEYVAQQVGGDRVSVASLTPPSTEPHDLELSPRQSREVADADVVVTLGGFQPAVDAVVEARAPEHHVDAAQVPAVAAHFEEETEDEDAHADEAEGEDDGHGHEGDPHFWLDPTLLAAVGEEVAEALAAADPAGADGYRERAAALSADLTALDEDFAAGLADCDRRVIVTAHEAFGFLAERYELEQAGISGVDPEAEPSPARVREIRDVVTEHGVTTIFTETLVDPAVAESLAADLGVDTAVLDPVESQVDERDYREVMLDNLAALREGLGCR